MYYRVIISRTHDDVYTRDGSILRNEELGRVERDEKEKARVWMTINGQDGDGRLCTSMEHDERVNREIVGKRDDTTSSFKFHRCYFYSELVKNDVKWDISTEVAGLLRNATFKRSVSMDY